MRTARRAAFGLVLLAAVQSGDAGQPAGRHPKAVWRHVTLTVHVKDPEGNPVPGMRVGGDTLVGHWSADTGRDGTAVVMLRLDARETSLWVGPSFMPETSAKREPGQPPPMSYAEKVKTLAPLRNRCGAPARVEVAAPKDKETAETTISLALRCKLSGRLVREDGTPVKRTKITPLSSTLGFVTTDDRGEFSVEVVPRGLDGSLCINVSGEPCKLITWTAEQAGAELRLPDIVLESPERTACPTIVCMYPMAGDPRIENVRDGVTLINVETKLVWSYPEQAKTKAGWIEGLDPARQQFIPAGEYWLVPGEFWATRCQRRVLDAVAAGEDPGKKWGLPREKVSGTGGAIGIDSTKAYKAIMGEEMLPFEREGALTRDDTGRSPPTPSVPTPKPDLPPAAPTPPDK